MSDSMKRNMERKKTIKKKISGSDRAFVSFNYLFLIIIFIITLYPLIFVASASISSPAAVASGKVILLPKDITYQGYIYLAGYKELWIGYGNTLFYTVVGTLLNLLFTIPAAYALSRRDMAGRNVIMAIFIFTMYFSGGLIPIYLNMKSLHLLNTRAVLLLGGLVAVYNLIVSRTFFGNTIPWELHEAAQIDGASDIKTFTRIILPLSRPILAVMTLYYGVGHWNSYFSAMIYIQDRKKFPLQLFLREVLTQSKMASEVLIEIADAEAVQAMLQLQDTANLLKYAVIIVSTLPMLLIYPWLQKYFEKGVMIGSVKG